MNIREFAEMEMTIQEFAEVLRNGQPKVGSYNIGFYSTDGRQHMETQLDVHVGDTLEDFYQLVEDDLLEADGDLDSIDYVVEAMPDEYLVREIITEIGNVPVDDNGCDGNGFILEDTNGFVAGKHTRDHMWHDIATRWNITLSVVVDIKTNEWEVLWNGKHICGSRA